MLDFPIFEADWGADEELLLVEGLELFGLGNWETISEHIGTKNSLQVAEHYNRVYVQSDAWPYPVLIDLQRRMLIIALFNIEYGR